MMNLEGKTVTEPENLNDLCAEDKWILSHLNTVIREATENMEKYELGIAVQKVYDFLWDELCDWYIEMAKVRLWKAEEDPKAANDALWTLRTALTEGLKLLHPYMPFITEEIYCTLLPEEESIMISEWPVYREERNFPDAEKAIEGFKEVVRGIRNTRTEMNVPNNRKTSLHIVAKDADTAAMYENSKKSFVNLAFAKEILVQTDKNGISEDAVSVVVSNAVVYMPLEDLIDKDKEIERLTKETERLTKEIARCEGMLNNPNFVNKAPAAKVDAEKDKLAKYKEMMDKVKGQLEQLEEIRECLDEIVQRFVIKFPFLLHVLASAVGYFVMEAICRHSFIEAWNYMTQKPLVFAYNTAFIFTSSLIVYLFRQESILESSGYVVLADTGHYQRCSPDEPCYTFYRTGPASDHRCTQDRQQIPAYGGCCGGLHSVRNCRYLIVDPSDQRTEIQRNAEISL